MIPKLVHYCRFGNRPITPLVARCLDSWRRFLPEYELKEWNDQTIPREVPYCQAAIDARRWSRLANYVRLYSLHEEGGIYLDTDMEIVRSLDPLLGEGCFLAFQQEQRCEDWVNNAVLGAEAGHAFLSHCINYTVEAFERDGVFLRSPTVTTAVLEQMGLRQYGRQRCENVTVLPFETFYPYPWYSRFSPTCVTEQTYGIHHWEASWYSNPFSRLGHFANRVRHATMARLRHFR